jgi:hypothetical protein
MAIRSDIQDRDLLHLGRDQNSQHFAFLVHHLRAAIRQSLGQATFL